MIYHSLALFSFNKTTLYEVTVGLLHVRQVYINTITRTVVVVIKFTADTGSALWI